MASDAPPGMTVPPPPDDDGDEEVDIDAAFEEETTGKVDMDRVRLQRSAHRVAEAKSSVSQRMRALREKLERSRGYIWVDREHLQRRSRPDFG